MENFKRQNVFLLLVVVLVRLMLKEIEATLFLIEITCQVRIV